MLNQLAANHPLGSVDPAGAEFPLLSVAPSPSGILLAEAPPAASAVIYGNSPKPAFANDRLLLRHSAGVYTYLVCLGLMAGATIGICYAVGFALLLQPPKQPTAGTAPYPAHDLELLLLPGLAAVPGPEAGPRFPGSFATTLPRHPAVGAKPPSVVRPLAAEIAAMLARGDELLRIGDIASARLFYERAADAGAGRGALRMAATYDPAFLAQIGARSMAGDPVKANFWYNRAHQLGEPEARLPVGAIVTN